MNNNNNNNTPRLYSYHTFNEWKLYKLDDEEAKYYIGFELEIDRHYNNITSDFETTYKTITDNINSILMRDGSLTSDGIEIISHPQTFNYIMAQKDKYKNAFETLRSYNYTSHDNNRCGLHFHFTRPNDEVVNRILLIVENFKNEILVFSRRTDTQWCRFIDEFTNTSKNITNSLYFIQKNKDKIGSPIDGHCNKRYHALNTTNEKTIEFRFCRGTLNIDTFLASLQLCNNIYTIASDLDKPINTIDWLDLIKGDECYNYCKEKNIITSHLATDNTDEIIKKVDQVKIQVNKLKDIIKDYQNWSVMTYKKDVKIRDIKTLDDLLKASRKADTYTRSISAISNLNYELENTDVESLCYNTLIRCISDLVYYIPTDYYKHRFNIIKDYLKKVVM